MCRSLMALVALATLSGCACALDDEDRAAGKPSIWQCVAAGAIEAVGCSSNNSNNCRSDYPSGNH